MLDNKINKMHSITSIASARLKSLPLPLGSVLQVCASQNDLLSNHAALDAKARANGFLPPPFSIIDTAAIAQEECIAPQPKDNIANFIAGYSPMAGKGIREHLVNRAQFYQQFHYGSPLANCLFPTMQTSPAIDKQTTQANFKHHAMLRHAHQVAFDHALAHFGFRRINHRIACIDETKLGCAPWLKLEGTQDRLLLIQIITSMHQLYSSDLAFKLCQAVQRKLQEPKHAHLAPLLPQFAELSNQIRLHPNRPVLKAIKPAPILVPDLKTYLSTQNGQRFGKKLLSHFRTSLANKVYQKMFAGGLDYKRLDHDNLDRLMQWQMDDAEKEAFQKAQQHKAQTLRPFARRIMDNSALKQLELISKENLEALKSKTPDLSLSEKQFIERMKAQPWHFRHQSNGNLTQAKMVDGKLTEQHLGIDSYVSLQAKGIDYTGIVHTNRIKKIANEDFVFFGLELSNDKQKMPMNTKYDAHDYGKNAYLIDESSPLLKYAYLTLSDHDRIHGFGAVNIEHKEFAAKFDNARIDGAEVLFNFYSHKRYQDHTTFFKYENGFIEHIETDDGENYQGEFSIHDKSPIFAFKHMKEALALACILNARKKNNASLNSFMRKQHTGEEMDKLVQLMFQPELHIPRRFTTPNFVHKNIREINLDQAVDAGNIADIITKAQGNRYLQVTALMESMDRDYPKPKTEALLKAHFDYTDEELKLVNTIVATSNQRIVIASMMKLVDISPGVVETLNEERIQEMKNDLSDNPRAYSQGEKEYYSKVIAMFEKANKTT